MEFKSCVSNTPNLNYKIMKKTLFAMAVIAISLFSSCGDDENGALNGTKWESTEEWGGEVYAKWELSFGGNSFVMKFNEDIDGDGKMELSEIVNGSYTATESQVSLNGNGMVIEGTYNENTMHFPETEESDEFTFYKVK